MVNRSASTASFLEDYQTSSKRLSASLRDYLGDPKEKNLHELRSSLRRMDALLRLLPDETRTSNTVRDYQKRCRKSLKLTSPIRDVDLLGERLRSVERDASIAQMTRRAAARRGKLVKDSMKVSWKLFENPAPKLGQSDLSGLDARIRDVMAKTERKMARLLPKVIASENRVDDLHTLRKHSKKLRYIIEVLPANEHRKRTGETMRSWQNILGAVHDSDVLIEYFKRETHSPSFRRLLRAERIRRHAQYAKFQRLCRTNQASAKGHETAPSHSEASSRRATRTTNDKSRS